jgi:microtubule-associated protein-like 6
MISVNTQAAELLFIGTAGNSISASSTCDEGWATWTQKFGFPVQGIFQGPDYSDINTVCRDPTKSFLAVGYDDQMIRFFKYPCYIPKQVFKAFSGHSSHVTRIRFCPNYMVSLGGEDKTIIVWEIDGRKLLDDKIDTG